MPQLDPTYFPSQILWLIISFVAIYFVAAKWGLPKVGEVLDERQNLIDGYLERAGALQQEADELLKSHDEKIHEARNEASTFLKEQAETLNQTFAQKHKDLEEKITEKLNASAANIETQKANFFEEVPALASQIAADILTKVDAHSNQNDLEDLVKKITKAHKNVH